MATTAALKPFVTVFKPNSTVHGISDYSKNEEFEKLYAKWKRRKEYRQKSLIKRSEQNLSRDEKCKSDEQDSSSKNPYQMYDFTSPPKLLEIKPIIFESRRKTKKQSKFPKIYVKPTIASLARRYFIKFYKKSTCPKCVNFAEPLLKNKHFFSEK